MWERLEMDLRIANARINELENALRPLVYSDAETESEELKRLLARAKLIFERKSI